MIDIMSGSAKRNILLVEPGYKNKYPPIGLMKISSYHRMLGDSVTFYKGDIKQFILDDISNECIEKLGQLNTNINWKKRYSTIQSFIKLKRIALLSEVFTDVEETELLVPWMNYYSDYYRKKEYLKHKKWDRIYVTTLFTFYWKITIKVIEDCKSLVKDLGQLKVGGVMASLLKEEIQQETGVEPISGLLDKPGILDDNRIVVDDLPLDYSILDEIEYKYPTGSAYFTFMTKGCTRTCAFCSVPKLEPTYKEKIPTIEKFEEIKEIYGEQQHLLLMDNNVLASPKFPEIIQEIKDMGFYKGAMFVEPNQLDIAVKNLKNGLNDIAYIKKCHHILEAFLDKRVKKQNAEKVYELLDKYSLLKLSTTTKENLVMAYTELKDIYEKYRDKTPKQRFVDFNQGTDARYVTEEYMRLLSEIPINPLRIAFDYIGLKKVYVNAIRLAANHGINRLSNYLLFNFKDKPEDLYNRIRINVDLSEELGIHIYSFPMKYIPLFGEEAKDRQHVGKFWNKKFIRSIQSISNVTRGIVPPGRSFFERAYGASLDEYFELLYMPETYIIYRKVFEELGYSQEWRRLYRSLSEEEKAEAHSLIELNDFKEIESKTRNQRVLQLLVHYTISREEVKKSDKEYQSIKQKFDRLVHDDPFVDLTLTYDYE
jgi:hypothetical protein